MNQELAVSAVLLAGLGILWRQYTGLREKQDTTSSELGNLKYKVGHLEGRQGGIEELSEKVLTTVHGAITDGQTAGSGADQPGNDTADGDP